MVSRTYLARVHGRRVRRSLNVEHRSLKRRQSWGHELRIGRIGCHDEVRVLSTLDDGTSLIEAEPLTGRTNQIRVSSLASQLAHRWRSAVSCQPSVGDAKYIGIDEGADVFACQFVWSYPLGGGAKPGIPSRRGLEWDPPPLILEPSLVKPDFALWRLGEV